MHICICMQSFMHEWSHRHAVCILLNGSAHSIWPSCGEKQGQMTNAIGWKAKMLRKHLGFWIKQIASGAWPQGARRMRGGCKEGARKVEAGSRTNHTPRHGQDLKRDRPKARADIHVNMDACLHACIHLCPSWPFFLPCHHKKQPVPQRTTPTEYEGAWHADWCPYPTMKTCLYRHHRNPHSNLPQPL